MNGTKTFDQPASSGMSRPNSGRMQPGRDLMAYAKDYARERPDVAALWCFGLGFILAWKLKPW